MAAISLSACTAGPDFVRPAPPALADYVAGEAPVRTAATDGPGGESQYFLRGENLPAGWWHWFGSPELVGLVESAFARNPDLAAARARLRAAAATLAAERGLLAPQVSAFGDVSYGSSQGGDGDAGERSAGGSDYAVYTAGGSVSYDLDIAGRNRRLIESAAAETERQRQELQAAYLAIIGNIVSTAFDSAALRAQIEAREELIEGQNRRIELIRIRVAEGAEPRTTLVTALAEVASIRAEVPLLRAELAAAENALAQLTGRPPAAADIPELTLAGLRLPAAVPIALPSRLVRTRPDILAAEALLNVASAEVGVETADLYPDITLDGSFGIGGVGSVVDSIFSVGAALLAPLFDGGQREAERDVAVALYEEALANYRSRVLAAFVEVANGIRALENDAAALAEQRTALEAARESLELTQFREQEGAVGPIEVLVVQQQYQDARFAYIDALARRFQDTAILFAALGSGPVPAGELAAITTDAALDSTRAALNAGVAPSAIPMP